MQFTDVTITTMTFTATLGIPVDLTELYESLPLGNGVLAVRSASSLECRPEKSMVLGKPFGKQVSIRLKIPGSQQNISAKIFSNGKIQMTGITSRHQAELVVSLLTRAMEVSAMMTDLRIRMVNSAMRCHSKIRRNRLYSLMGSVFGIHTTFEPCTYPAVKIILCFPRVDGVNTHDGTCTCVPHCGTISSKHRRCYRVFASIYGGGYISIAGSCEIAHIVRSSELVKSFLLDNEEKVCIKA